MGARMMKKVLLLIMLVAALLSSSCRIIKMKKNNDNINKFINALRFIRKNPNFDFTEEQRLNRYFYRSLCNFKYKVGFERIKECLNNGCSPNYCYGECGWVESSPLLFLAARLYESSYTRIHYPVEDEMISFPADVQLLQLLLDKGADISHYPYVFAIIHERDELTYGKDSLMDYNRILKAFLENGADVNKKGHPYPFSYEYSYESLKLTPEEAYKDVYQYFNSSEATTPLYEAIKKGIVWESQVDLLLEYGATLDETCLEAARLSEDYAMVEKINKLWENRNR